MVVSTLFTIRKIISTICPLAGHSVISSIPGCSFRWFFFCFYFGKALMDDNIIANRKEESRV